jgi:hypothetical protein
MNKKKDFSEKPVEDVLAICLDLIKKDKWTIQDCLEHFPHHKNELEMLLKKYVYLNKYPAHSPRLIFKENGYKQLVGKLSASQSVTFQHFIHNIKSMFSWKIKWSLGVIQIIIITLLALTAVTGGVVYASDEAEPGDPLYGLDRAVEQLGLALAVNPESAAQFHLEIAIERLEEARGRLLENDFENVEIALNSYGDEISLLAQIAGRLGGADQEELTESVNTELAVHQKVLTGLLDEVPQQAQEAIQRAITASNLEFEKQPGPPEGAGPPEEVGPHENAGPPEEAGPPKTPPGLNKKDCTYNISAEDALALEEMAAAYGIKYKAILRMFCDLGSLEQVEQKLQGKQSPPVKQGPPGINPGRGRP